ncbi:MFS transporter [Nonomuraea sp. MG754425]|uniref:MFS transporter n=1 Tax=Nonomuraea sp. MG754425 TaxID=2570319 RepID=UPI001F027E61|nr:MFS transporter [Nonomuraea sp. MG754425]MCF6469265.1 MFS transporter [Nonomuraea sp. MG754425]
MLVVSLYAYAFLSEFILLYPVYTLLFTDTGLSVAQTSSLFVIWSVTGMVLEVPSGAWADTVSRRLLLCLGPLLTGLGFAAWVLFPSYWVFAAGFVLWGAGEALVSGSYEALAYEEMGRRGMSRRYAGVMGRASALGLAGSAGAIGLAAPVFATGGYPVVGAASVLACVLCAAVALTLPEHRTPGASREVRYLTILREGIGLARADRGVLRAMLTVAFVTAIWGALEEYVPFLGAETGVAKATIPLLILLVWVGATAGGLLAGAAERLPARGYGLLLGLAALLMGAGALSGHPAGFVAIALAVGAFQLAQVLADVRLQERISGPARATATSVAGLGTNVVTLGVYAAYGAASPYVSHGVAFALLTLPYLAVAVLTARQAGR